MSTTWLRRLLKGRSSKGTCRHLAKPPYRPGVEFLETRVTPSTVKWFQPGSGNWSDVSRWIDVATNTPRVPGATDVAVIDVTGPAYTVTVDVDIAVAGLTLDSSTATLAASNHTFVVNGPGTLSSGTLDLTSATWDGTGTLTNNAKVLVHSFPTIKSTFVQNGNVIIEGATDHAQLTVANSFTNTGTITLTTVTSGRIQTLAVTSGTLTNSGTIAVDDGVGGSNTHTFAADINNVGTITINADTADLSTKTITNTGTFQVAAGHTFNSKGTFNQNGGSIKADGTFYVNNVGQPAPSGAVLSLNAGALTGTVLVTNSALINGVGNPTGTVAFESYNTLAGDVPAGETLIIRGDSDHAGLTAASSFTNAGSIVLTTLVAGRIQTLAVTSGTLTNSGSIEVNDGVGGGNAHTFAGDINNVGTITINADTTDLPTTAITNSGTFQVAAGHTFNSKGTFNQNGGTIKADGTFYVNNVGQPAPSGAVLSLNAGALTGNVLVTNSALVNGTGNPTGTIVFESNNTVSGDVPAGVTLIIRGDSDHAGLTSASSFTNAGRIVLTTLVAGRIQTLAVTSGTLTNTGSIEVNDGVGGSNTHTFAGDINNVGTITINADTTDLPTTTITNTGTFHVAVSHTFNSKGTFNQNGGSIKADGTFYVNNVGQPAPSGAVLSLNAGALTGNVLVTNSALVNGTGNPTGMVIFQSYNTVTGDIAPGEMLIISASIDHGALTAVGSLTNAGTIVLRNDNGGDRDVTLADSTGVLTNTGTIRVLDSLGAGHGGRVLAATIVNQGLIELDQDTTQPNDVAITNNGTVTIAENITYIMRGFFNQFTGRINVNGNFVLPGAPATFNFNGGLAAGHPIQLFSSVLTNGPGDPVGTFVFQGSNSMSGDVAPGETLLIDGNSDNAYLTAASGFTNAGTIILRNDNGGSGREYVLVVTNGVLTNTGAITMGGGASPGGPRLEAAINNSGSIFILETASLGVVGAGASNSGTLDFDAPNIAFKASSLANSGLIFVHGNSVTFPGAAFNTNGSGTLFGRPQGSVSVAGDFLGNGRNADGFNPIPVVHLTGPGSQASPHLFEVMGKDLGAVVAGFSHNFVINSLNVEGGNYVKLVDNADNYSGTGAEALYVNNLIVTGGATLELNGLHVYTRAQQNFGNIVGGTVTLIPDGGPLFLGEPAPGTIASSGEIDDWTFFGRAGQSISAIVDVTSIGGAPPLQSVLNFVQLDVTDSTGKLVATGNSSQSGSQLSLIGMELPVDGIYHFKVKAPADHSTNIGNYVLTVNASTNHAYTLDLNRTVHGNLESYGVDRWSFTASAGQQIRFGLEAVASSALEFDLVGPNGYSAFVNAKSGSDLITLPATGTYAVLVHAESDEDGGYSFRVDQTTATTLALGSPFSGTIAGSGQYQLFKLEVPNAGQVQVALLDPHAADHNELYVRFGLPPTRTSYQYKFTSPALANQILSANVAEAGTLYVLMFTDSAPVPSTFTLVARLSQIAVNDVTPNKLGNGQDAVLTIFGGGFDPTTTVSLIASNSTVLHAATTQVDSATQITVTFGAGAVPAGDYTVRVSHADGESADLPNGFTFTSGGQALLKTNIVIPNPIGYHIASTLYAEYTNAGDLAMPAPLLVLTATQKGVAGALLTLDATKITSGFWTTANPEGYGQSIQILASGKIPGQLLPGESARVPVYYGGWLQGQWDFSRPPIIFTLGVIDQNNAVALDLDAMKSTLRPTNVSTAAWEPIFQNLKSNVRNTWGGFVKQLDDNANYLGHLGENVNDISKLWSFVLQQAIGFNPVVALASATDASMAAPGMSLTLGRSFPNSIIGRNEIGPFGAGWSLSGGWQQELTVETDGTVVISAIGGNARQFAPDSRHANTYFTQSGDHGLLSNLGGGAYTLQETDGMVTAFLPSGQVNYFQDTNGNRITAGYTSGLLTSLTHSSEQALQLAYNAGRRITSITDSAGRVTAFAYDAANEHLLSVTAFDGQITTYTYGGGSGGMTNNALLSVAHSDGTHDFFLYDNAGRLTGINHDDGQLPTTFAYDLGQVKTTDGTGAIREYFYDYRGLLTKVLDPLKNPVSFTYDANFNLIQIADAADRVTSNSYDSKGNLISTTDALGESTQFGYAGPFNRLASFTDANSNGTAYHYDGRGNLLSTTYADGSVEKVAHDALGDPTSFTNRRGDLISYAYDASGRIVLRTFADGSNTSYVYDARDNLASATDTSGTTTFSYDSGDRLLKVVYPDGKYLQYAYDAAGRRVQMVDQDGFTISYGYDTLGRLFTLTDGLGNSIIKYSYDANGRLSRKDMGDGTFTTYAYDLAGQLLQLVNHGAGGALNSEFDYAYDRVGNQTGMKTPDGQWTLTYDAVGRLVHAVLASNDPSKVANQDLLYVYDGAGNRTQTVLNGTTTGYVVNNQNQYTSVGSTRYVFDADGNLVSKTDSSGITAFTYDDLNRLVGVQTPTDTFSYRYDALGNLVSKSQNGNVTKSLIDPNGLPSVVSEYSGTGLISHYVQGSGLVSQISAGGSTSYYDADGLGSTVGLTNASGVYSGTTSYLPFGQILTATGSGTGAFGFVGQLGISSDASGLMSMRARFYDANLGRFLTTDPSRIDGGLNLYAYVSNNPLQLVDPSGLHGLSDAEGANAVVNGAWLSAGVGAGLGAAVGWFTPIGPVGGAAIGAVAGAILGATRNAYGAELPDEGAGSDGSGSWDSPGSGSHGGGGGGAHNGGGTTGSTGNASAGAGTGHQGGAPGGSEAAGPGAGGASAGANSQDPNQITGPAGYGAGGFVLPNTSFAYQIEFENDPTATAPAQRVFITDQIDSRLDWNTFQFTSVDFGDTVIQVPASLQNFSTAVSMTYNNQTFEVDIDLSFDPVRGLVTVIYQSINPDTELPPDVLTGFLPPEDNTGRGTGHVNFFIQPKAGLPTGTQIRNVAVITFDSNPPISTDQVDPLDASKGTDPAKQALNTIDAGAPASSIVALPATSPTSFTLSWSGSDDAGGSGIATYDIYVSDNGSQYTVFQMATKALAAPFSGIGGHIYSFYSVATDNVGNRQPTPGGAQTSTTISSDSTPPTSKVSILPIFSKPGFTVSWSGSDSPGGGVASYDIYVSDNGAPFTIWLTATTQTSAKYTGLAEHTYAFYSRALDFAGNREAAPASGQATTQTLLDTPSRQYVAAVYVTLLQRPVDLGGLNYWSGRLDHGDARGVIADQLTHSDEYFATNVIKPAYQQFLDRSADQDGLDFWTAKLQGGLTDEQMQAGFIASDEFYRSANHSGATVPVSPAHDRAWVDALYMALLGRGPDQIGEDYWTGQLQGQETRLQVANDFTGSTEGLSVRIQQTYQRYLGRSADSGGLAFWLSKYHAGAVNEDIVTGFISSDEFYDGATKPG